MFDIGWSELLIIGVVALIVIGPKDLPDMFRTLGRFTAKAKGMARDFSRAMESAADEAGVKDVAKDLRNVTSPKSMGLDAVKSAASKFESWDPMKAAKSAAPKPDPAAPKPPAPDAVPKGPATQALADAQAAKRAELVAKAEPAAAAVAEPAAKAKPAPRKAAAKTAAKATEKPAVKKASAAKPSAKKPATKKPAVKKPTVKKSDA
ncbi:Sec-independent protein translocase protein TatB [Pseudorhodobacter wandonensis]|uniref:Sec-independent protein translocase protein TatB n=1 Tax=Pseudorhodobacter wandonensis TaxID=1120568 RepID=UPI0009E60246|nr:Sec-independent protein translocase protein TatB [Pseudorhodobacter wandonensis]